MASTLSSDGSVSHLPNDAPLHLTRVAVSGFADNLPPSGNLFAELDTDESHRQRCALKLQGDDLVLSDQLSNTFLPVNPSSLIYCELWVESEDHERREKICECTVTVSEAICEANACEHKTGQHEWSFEVHAPGIADYQLPSVVDEPAEGLTEEIHQTLRALHNVSEYIPTLSGDQWMYQEQFNVAWRMFTVAAFDLMNTAEPCRAALDDALRDTLAQLRLGMGQFATRAKQGSNSRRAMHWADGLDLVNRSIVLAAALLDKYTKGLNSASSRIRSLFLDRCQDLQDDIIRYRIMFIQNHSASRPLDRDIPEDPLVVLMSHLVASTDYDDVLLSLRGRLAGRVLELLQDGIPNVENYFPFSRSALLPPSNIIRQRLRGLFEQIAETSERIPPSLFLDGIKWNSEVLSRGKFSDVTAGMYKKERIVIKRIKLPIKNASMDTSESTKKLLQKALEWRTIKHEHLVPFVGVTVKKLGKDSDGLHLVFPRMESSVLNVLARKTLKDADKPALIHGWMLEIAEALSYLHGDNIVHGDLRARNVLVDRNSVRISDYGLAALADEAGVNFTATHPGLARWLAPELLAVDASTSPAQRTFASDVYAFACVCVELYTCKAPFVGVADKQVAPFVLQGTHPTRPTIPGKPDAPMDEALWNILDRCWNTDPSQRPTAAEIWDDLHFFVHGEKRQAIVEEAPAIFDEPESISPRSGSPETVSSEVTSPPETPMDTPMINSQNFFAPRTVGSYNPIVEVSAKPVKGASPDGASAPYPVGDPSHSSDSADSVRGALADDEGSTVGSSSGSNAASPAAPVESALPITSQEEQKTPEISDPVVVFNEVIEDPQATPENPEPSAEKPRHEETRTTHEPEKTAQEPITSDMIHEQHTDMIINDTPLAEPTAAVVDVPESGLEKPESTAEPVIVNSASVVPIAHDVEEIVLHETADVESPAASPVDKPADLQPAAAETAKPEPIPLTVDVPEEPAARDGVSSEAVPTDAQGASQLAPDSLAAYNDKVETDEPVSGEAQEADNSHVIVEVTQANNAPEETTPEPSQPQPEAKPVETNTSDMAADASPASAPEPTETEPATTVKSAEESKAVDEPQEVHEVHADTEAAEVAPVVADEHAPAIEEHTATDVTAAEPAAVVPEPTAHSADATEKTVTPELTYQAPVVIDIPEASPADVAQEAEKEESEETAKPLAPAEKPETPEQVAPEQPPASAQEAAAPVATTPASEAPAVVAEPETEKVAHADDVPATTTTTPVVEVVDETPEVPAAPADKPTEEELDDSELAPPPNVVTKDDSVFRRGSVRLVTPPPASEEDELPKVAALNPQPSSEELSEPQPEAKPEPQPEAKPEPKPVAPKKAEDTGIQQESREQQPAVGTSAVAPASTVPANGDAARKATASPKPKNGKKKAGKDADDVPGCCAKCVIM